MHMDVVPNKNNVLGLLIRLKKYGLKKRKAYNGKNIILGYYDCLEIEKVQNWFDFSPRRASFSSPSADETLTITQYPLRLLFPRDCDTIRNPSYTNWMELDNLILRSPCITLVLINLTDEFKSHNKFENLLCLIETMGNGIFGDAFTNANVCVLRSLGYSDCCILMADDSWDFALKFVEALHNKRDANNNPILSTDYFIPVFTGNQSTKPLFSCVSDNLLSVRINLEPGCTSQMLANSVPNGVDVFRTSGGADCLLVATTSEATQDLFSTMISTTSASDPINLIIDLSSVIQLKIARTSEQPEILETLSEKIALEKSRIPEELVSFNKAVEDFKVFLQEHSQHTRQASALKELSADIQNICTLQHTESIKKILLRFIYNVSECLERCCSQPDLLDQIMENVDYLHRCIDSFLADLSRSDSLFMERERYNHPSVGSTTSMLLAYSCWINKFAQVVQGKEKNSTSYAFLVTSGGCDETHTTDPFYYLDPEIENNALKENLPLLIQMSEMSLFDISGTLLRVSHECMHFCGERFRVDRKNAVVSFIATFYGDLIGNLLFNNEYKNRIIKTISLFKEFDESKTLNDKIEKYYSDNLDSFCSEIAKKIEMDLSRKLQNSPKDIDWLMQILKDKLVQAMTDFFAPLQVNNGNNGEILLSFNDFAKFLFVERKKCIMCYYENCNNLFIDNNIPTVYCAFDNVRFSKNKTIADDPASATLIHEILSALLMTNDLPNATQSLPLGEVSNNNLFDVLDSVSDIFSESFADVAACTALGVCFEDYILMHVSENWDLDRCLKQSYSFKYRIPAIIKICFFKYIEQSENSISLTSDAKTKLKMSIEQLIKHGYPSDRLKAKDIVSRINKLLHDYPCNLELENYLKKCKNAYESQNFSGFRQAYKAIRILQIDSANAYGIIEMVKHFISQEEITKNELFFA